jgi:hypothetical protein
MWADFAVLQVARSLGRQELAQRLATKRTTMLVLQLAATWNSQFFSGAEHWECMRVRMRIHRRGGNL